MNQDSPSKSGDNAYAPISRVEDVERLRVILSEKPRDLLLFEMAIQTGMLMKDILKLKAGQLIGVEVGETIPFHTGHRKAVGHPVMTRQLHDTFGIFCQAFHPKEDDFLFKSRKGNRPISLTSASVLINKWYEAAGLRGLSGASSLRKTFEANQEIFQRLPWRQSRPDPASVFEPIKPQTLQEQVYDQLLKAIISGRIPPGEQLVIEKVAENMQVSPMPVREALVRLEAAGVVMSTPKRRCIVKRLSPQDLAEILEIRLMLESKAAEIACLRSNREFVTRLREINRHYLQARSEGNVELFLKINRQFHYTIYWQAQKSLLIEIINNLWDRASPYLHVMFQEMSRSEYQADDLALDHKEIINGMEQRDPEKVMKHLQQDLIVGSRLVQKLFSQTQ